MGGSIGIHGGTTIGELTDQPKAPSSAVTSVAGSALSVTLLAANTNREGASIFNDSSVFLYVKLGATASLVDFTVKVPPASLYELPIPVYTGVIDGIWDSATGFARITETT